MSSETDIQALIEGLGSKAGSERHAARRGLVRLGADAVPALNVALGEGSHNARWGAAKALGEIGDPRSAPALVAALEDDDSDVRWLAAKALPPLREEGLVALATAIRDTDLTMGHHHAALHVLHDLQKRGFDDELAPLVAAVEGDSPEVHAPLAAAELLRAMGA